MVQMAPSVQITFIICFTMVLLSIMSGNRKK